MEKLVHTKAIGMDQKNCEWNGQVTEEGKAYSSTWSWACPSLDTCFSSAGVQPRIPGKNVFLVLGHSNLRQNKWLSRKGTKVRPYGCYKLLFSSLRKVASYLLLNKPQRPLFFLVRNFYNVVMTRRKHCWTFKVIGVMSASNTIFTLKENT